MTPINKILNRKGYKLKILYKGNKPEWLNIDSPQIEEYDIIIGWDTEYRNREWEIDLEKHKLIEKIENVKKLTKSINELDKKRSKKCLYNEIISHQIVAYSKNKNCYIEFIIFLYNQGKFEKRIDLSKILSIIFELLDYKWDEIKSRKLLLTSHYSVAEFSALSYSDRKPLSKHLNTIQKTLSSFSFFKWIVQKYEEFSESEKKNVKTSKVKIQWRDTILLAPVGYKSLKKLATQTFHVKPDLKQEEYINMAGLLENNPSRYEEYAINDSKIALEFYCKFMHIYYYKLTNKLEKKSPLTAIGSSELNFLARQREESKKLFKDKNKLKKVVFGLEKNGDMITSRENDEGMINKCYLGGRNNIAKYYKNYDCRKNNKIIIDIDIADAYSRGFGLIALPDWNSRWKRVISTEKYAKDVAQQHNKELEFTKMGFFETKFNFSEEIYEPPLAQKTKWGLIYTKEGKTRATFPEMMEAQRLNGIGENDIRELIVYDELLIEGKLYYPFAEYIKMMTKLRKNFKKGTFENLMFKEQKNGLYGKTGQGIETRQFFTLTGEKELLKPSRITNAEIASHITGIIRTALGAMINEIEDDPRCEVINWTTDGCMILMDWNEENYPEFEVWKEGEKYNEDCWGERILSTDNEKDKGVIGKIKQGNNGIHFKDLNPELYEKLINLRTVKYLIKGGKKIGEENKDSWLEIKGFGDRFGSETTRGNWMTWKNVTQGLARGNIGSKIIKTAEDFQRYTETDDISEAVIDNLVNIREMIEDECDLVVRRKIEKGKQGKKFYKQSFRKINLGPDGKRKIKENGVDTEPFKDITEAAKYRATIEHITRKEIRKTTQNVIWHTKAAISKKIRGSKEETIYRTIMTLILQENIMKSTYEQISQKINENKLFKREIKISDLKNWKRKRILIKSIPKVGFEEVKQKFERLMKVDLQKIDFENYLF